MECRHWREYERAYFWMHNPSECSFVLCVLQGPAGAKGDKGERVSPTKHSIFTENFIFFLHRFYENIVFHFTKECFTVFIFGWKQFNLSRTSVLFCITFHYISLFSLSWPNLKQIKSLLVVHFCSRAGCNFFADSVFSPAPQRVWKLCDCKDEFNHQFIQIITTAYNVSFLFLSLAVKTLHCLGVFKASSSFSHE